MTALTQALSAALIHFVWQGSIVGFLLWIALSVLRNRSANVRYAVSCAALGLLVVLPVFTAAVLYMGALPADVRAGSIAASTQANVHIADTIALVGKAGDVQRIAWLARLQIWALPLWSIGVLLFSIRLAFGGAQAFALGRRGEPADESVLARVRRLAARMGVARPVRVLLSTLTDSPAVVGCLRPVILLTPASLVGLSAQQLEAVLAHEIAHIRRHDYLVNVLQMAVETLLFYHPAVWWTSRQIRRERELCCDDIAVQACGDALCYARALTTLEKARVMPSLAMGGNGGPLRQRIERLLGVSTREYGPSRWRGVIAISLGIAGAAIQVNWIRAQAQSQVAPARQFDVASIKPNKSGGRGLMHLGYPSGRFSAANVPLRMLLRNAYDVQDFQISGGPSWIDVDRFDIEAKPEGDATFRETQGMLRALLAERFKLTVHTETRELPLYALVMARKDNTRGSQLRQAGEECRLITTWPGAPSPPPPPPGPPGEIRRDLPRCPSMFAPGAVSGRDMTIARLATTLSQWVNRIVLDRTNLTGNFDLDLQWTPDQMSPRPPVDTPGVVGGSTNPLPPTATDSNGASLFTALQEQLGLKLEPERGPVDVLVIDRVEKPTED